MCQPNALSVQLGPVLPYSSPSQHQTTSVHVSDQGNRKFALVRPCPIWGDQGQLPQASLHTLSSGRRTQACLPRAVQYQVSCVITSHGWKVAGVREKKSWAASCGCQWLHCCLCPEKLINPKSKEARTFVFHKVSGWMNACLEMHGLCLQMPFQVQRVLTLTVKTVLLLSSSHVGSLSANLCYYDYVPCACARGQALYSKMREVLHEKSQYAYVWPKDLSVLPPSDAALVDT